MVAESSDQHVLVLAPTGRDGPLIGDVLARAGVTTVSCADVRELCEKLRQGAGAVVLAEEALDGGSMTLLIEELARQPKWSDVPLVVLTGGGKTTQYSTRIARELESRSSVTLLERPLRILTLVSAIQSSLRARLRQYEVRDLLEKAQHEVRQRDQFLAMLGHELRNPLGAIRTSIEVLKQIDGREPRLAAENREIISRQSAHVARLVDDLLDVARVTSGKITLNRATVDLREIVRQSLRSLGPGIPAQHQIELEEDPHPVMVEGDAVRLDQIVNNLLTNAVKYTPAGGSIRVRVGTNGGEAVFSVRDDGVGIAMDMIDRVFEPFVQVDQSLDRSRGGLGIGLSVVRRLVEMHAGRVSASSGGPGAGSEFTIRLPLTRSEQGRRPDADPCEGTGGSKSVLIVEDGVDARRAMAALLRLWGHRVITAEDGHGGIQKAVREKPDVALVDIGLPGLSGYDVARAVRAELGKSICLIALTGYGQVEDRQRAVAAGFDRHLVKPVDPRLLEQVLAGHPVAEEARA